MWEWHASGFRWSVFYNPFDTGFISFVYFQYIASLSKPCAQKIFSVVLKSTLIINQDIIEIEDLDIVRTAFRSFHFQREL
jgi:hypothetical protein